MNHIVKRNLKEQTFFIWLILLTCSLPEVFAQGNVANQDILIEKEQEIEIKPAQKPRTTIKPRDIPKPIQGLSYDFVEPDPQLFSPIIAINPPQGPIQNEEDVYVDRFRAYFKAGAGNYESTLLQANIYYPIMEKWSLGLDFQHRASRNGEVADRFSGFSENRAELSTRYWGDKSSWYAQLLYHRDLRRFYGYNPESITQLDRDTLKQNYQLVGARVRNALTDPDAEWKYTWDLKFQNLWNSLDAQEWQVDLVGNLEFYLLNPADLQIETQLFFSNLDDVGSVQRNYFRLNPSYAVISDPFRVDIGFHAVYQNDSIGNTDNFHLYPDLRASWQFSPNLQLFAGFQGNMLINSLDKLRQVNPWIDRNVAVFHTNKKWEIEAGAQLQLATNWTVRAFGKWAHLENQFFFLNSPADSSRFAVVYDTGTSKQLELGGQISFEPNERYHLHARGSVFSYNMDLLEEAWHRPRVEVQLMGEVYPLPQLKLGASALILNGIRAQNPLNDQKITLDTFLDLSIDADYSFFKVFSAFLSVNNILNQDYQRYLYYPNQGINFLIGLTYAF